MVETEHHGHLPAGGLSAGVLSAWTLEQVDEGIIVLNREWLITYANATAAKLVAADPAALVGQSFWAVFDRAEGTEFDRAYRRAMATGKPEMFEAYYGPLTGWFEVRALPLAAQLVLLFRNINARKESEGERDRLLLSLEHSVDRGRRLLALTERLTTAVTVDDVASAVTNSVRTDVRAVFAGIALITSDGEALHYISLDPLPVETAQEWGGNFLLTRSAPPTVAVRSGRPLFHPSIDEALAEFPHMADDFRTAGAEALIHLPLVATGSALGVLALTWDTAQTWSVEERAYFLTVARYVGQALQRALLFEAQRDGMRTLQAAVLPDSLPPSPGLELAASYRPAEQSLHVGGDWYDVLVLPDGSTALIVGDVAGHGVPAAAVMAQVRHTLRAYLLRGDDVGTVLAQTNDALLIGGGSALATVVLARLDTGRSQLSVARAGHPPVVIVDDSGGQVLDPQHQYVGVMLGVVAGATYPVHTVPLQPGATVLLYTDGLIEDRVSSVDEGIEILAHTAGTLLHAGPPTQPLEHIVDLLVRAVLGGRGADDDICVLAATLSGTSEDTDPQVPLARAAT